MENTFLLIRAGLTAVSLLICLTVLLALALLVLGFGIFGIVHHTVWLTVAAIFLLLIFFGYRSYRKKNPRKSSFEIFLKNYNQNPSSELTISSFAKISPATANDFFNISYSTLDDGLVISTLKETFYTPNFYGRSGYLEFIKFKVESIEAGYKKYQEQSFNFDAWKRGWFAYEQPLLENYSDVCLLLKKTPIPELIEDFQLAKQKRQEAEETEIKRQQEKRALENLVLQEKYNFLQSLLDSTKGKNFDRETISNLLVEGFEKKFKPMLGTVKKAYRINGVWFVEIGSEKFELKNS